MGIFSGLFGPSQAEIDETLAENRRLQSDLSTVTAERDRLLAASDTHERETRAADNLNNRLRNERDTARRELRELKAPPNPAPKAAAKPTVTVPKTKAGKK